MRNNKVLSLTKFSILLAIEAIFCFTFLGSIPIPFTSVVATLAAIPIVITAIMLGPWAGTLMGFFAGLFSLIVWTMASSNPMALIFSPAAKLGEFSGSWLSLIVCFVPRILVGTVSGLLFKVFSKHTENKFISYGVSGLIGSFINTIGVLGLAYIFFAPTLRTILGESLEFSMFDLFQAFVVTTALANGIPEAILAFLSAALVCPPLQQIASKTE